MQKVSPKNFFTHFFFSLGFYMLGFYWIPHTLTEFGNIPAPFNHLLGVNSLFVISPHIFVFALLTHLLRNKIPKDQLQYITKTIIFLIVQYITPQLFSAYPGHSWMKIAPFLYPASIFGEYAFSFISILLSYELVHLYREKRFNIVNMAFAALCIVFYPNVEDKKTSQINVRIAQANIGNNAKLSAEKGLPNSVSTVLSSYEKIKP